MFDLASSKLLILGMVALIVVGPKDLPILLRTIGKYVGMIRRQATEFRSQFDEAMRDSELDQIKRDVETMGADMEKTMREAELSVEQQVSQANAELDSALARDAAPPFGTDHPAGEVTPQAAVEAAPSSPAQATHAADSEPAAPAKAGA